MLTIALAAYLVASVLYVANLFVSTQRPAAAATVVIGVGALAHTVGLLGMVAETGRGPYSTVYGSVAFMAWLLVLMQIGLTWRHRMYALGAFSVPIALLMLVYALALPPEMRELLPGLRRQSLAAHISVTLLGYGAFAVAFGLAVIYLMESRLLKAKHLEGVFRRLPPLRTTEETAARFAAFGHAMLTLGIVIGSVWAVKDWDGGFWRDPKVIPSLVTWAIYTGYLGLRWVAGWRGRSASYLLVVGFVAVLLTFVGVNILYPGLHGVNQ
ncbi:MAG: cytochrome c biogenesis protein CcsA [Armatimonadetes bacterium]|nr:cytochrome c biogenesis protein CcsA [Armatimonadota bacterium]